MKEQCSRPLVPAKLTRRSPNRSGTRKFPCCRGRCRSPHKKYISAVLRLRHFQLRIARQAPEPEPAAESELSNGEAIESMTSVAPRRVLPAATTRLSPMRAVHFPPAQESARCAPT